MITYSHYLVVTVTVESLAAVKGRAALEAVAVPDVATVVATGKEEINRATSPAIDTTVFSSPVIEEGRVIPSEVIMLGNPVTIATIVDTTCITLKKAGVLENNLPTSSAKKAITVCTVELGVVVESAILFSCLLP